jgi:hypothetical protein
MYVSFLGISGALHLAVFEQPVERVYFSNLLESLERTEFPPEFIRPQEQGRPRASGNHGEEGKGRFFSCLPVRWTIVVQN